MTVVSFLPLATDALEVIDLAVPAREADDDVLIELKDVYKSFGDKHILCGASLKARFTCSFCSDGLLINEPLGFAGRHEYCQQAIIKEIGKRLHS